LLENNNFSRKELMMAKNMRIKEGYFDRARRSRTWSGIPVKGVYRPEDIKEIDYNEDLGEPGDYPFTTD